MLLFFFTSALVACKAPANDPLLQTHFKQTAVAAARHVKATPTTPLPLCAPEYFLLGNTYPAPGVSENNECEDIHAGGKKKKKKQLQEKFTIIFHLYVYLPEREAPPCRQQSSTAPRAHNTGALLFFIRGVQSRFPDIFHALHPETHTGRRRPFTELLHSKQI